ncbi:MAG: hypothetical protein Q8L15_01310 [Methylobacter sp.]|nr:hypothetical protein [Methylobacter sp.]
MDNSDDAPRSSAHSIALSVQVNGSQITDTGAAASIQLNASEGVPLTLELFGRDTDADLIEWAATGLSRGMTLDVPSASNGNLAVLIPIPINSYAIKAHFREHRFRMVSGWLAKAFHAWQHTSTISS